jgi:hypothetical protein
MKKSIMIVYEKNNQETYDSSWNNNDALGDTYVVGGS